MLKKYEDPKMIIIDLNFNDVICTSIGSDEDEGEIVLPI